MGIGSFGPPSTSYATTITAFRITPMPLSRKRKLENDDENDVYSESLLSDVDAEIALEISLRKRLVDTLEARIDWAIALKETLQQQGVHTFLKSNTEISN